MSDQQQNQAGAITAETVIDSVIEEQYPEATIKTASFVRRFVRAELQGGRTTSDIPALVSEAMDAVGGGNGGRRQPQHQAAVQTAPSNTGPAVPTGYNASAAPADPRKLPEAAIRALTPEAFMAALQAFELHSQGGARSWNPYGQRGWLPHERNRKG
jgi:hypothetical protein